MKIEGVLKVDVNYTIGRATITFDDTKVTYEEIKERLKQSNVIIQGEPKWLK
jgi:copper chaperone CopZ